MNDCVIVGAGPAGLAASAALTARGVDHLVLERGRAGHTWRTQRWDGLRLNNPGWMNAMLGDQPPDTYLTAAEVVARLERLAVCAPIREHVTVVGLSPRGVGWDLHTTDGLVQARTVIVATGGENVPRTPALAWHLPARIAQLHSSDYRRPDQLSAGPVLIVGSAQSGYQIAEELLGAGRRVVVATSRVGRAPPGTAAATRAGATLTGRLLAVDGRELRFDDSAAANIAAADAFATRIRDLLDEAVRPNGSAPAVEPDPADAPVTLDPPPTLRATDIDSVIWCTGYTGDFSWLHTSLRDNTGRPRRHGAAAARPGLWYLGLRWLTRRRSGNFFGFPVDAAGVADAVAATLGSNRRPSTASGSERR